MTLGLKKRMEVWVSDDVETLIERLGSLLSRYNDLVEEGRVREALSLAEEAVEILRELSNKVGVRVKLEEIWVGSRRGGRGGQCGRHGIVKNDLGVRWRIEVEKVRGIKEKRSGEKGKKNIEVNVKRNETLTRERRHLVSGEEDTEKRSGGSPRESEGRRSSSTAARNSSSASMEKNVASEIERRKGKEAVGEGKRRVVSESQWVDKRLRELREIMRRVKPLNADTMAKRTGARTRHVVKQGIQPREPKKLKDYLKGLVEVVEYARREVERKRAGIKPAGFLTKIDEIKSIGFNEWKKLIRNKLLSELVTGRGRLKYTYSPPSKLTTVYKITGILGGRVAVLPSKVPASKVSLIHALIDTSGSMGLTELKAIADALFDAFKYLRPKKILVTPWDVIPYETVEVKSSHELEKLFASGIKGGGGTLLSSALDEAITITERLKPSERKEEYIVIYSDWGIADNIENVAERIVMLQKMIGATQQDPKVVFIVSPYGNENVAMRVAAQVARLGGAQPIVVKLPSPDEVIAAKTSSPR